MSTADNKGIKWQQVVGIGLLCSLAMTMTACNRSDKVDQEALADEIIIVDDNAVAPAIACDNPLVQDRLKQALKNTLNQQVQSLAANYANAAEISLNSGSITAKVSSILVDIQNAAIIQQANTNGMTTCQASVSMILPSEDLYQASQIQAANNQPSLQTRFAQNNIRINNNMLVDDAFTYVIGTQGGQVQTRIAGQPPFITLVSEVIAGSAVKSVIDEQRVERQAQLNERRREAVQNNEANRVERQPQVVTPLEPIRPVQPVRPVEPVAPPTINQGKVQSNTQAATPTTKAAANVPKDDSIDMVIIEDDSAIY